MNGNFRVGPWLVEPSLNTLSQNGTSVRLEPKQIEVLVCLARHQGETVSKENLLQTVWPDTFVGDDVLVRCIFVLRRLFEDDPKKPDFIQTIARRGYRLVAPVVWENEGGTARGNSGRQTSELRKTTTLGRALRYGLGLAGAVLVLGLSFLSNLGGIRTWLLPEKAPSIRFLAVLPLQNLSGDPAQDYFADGMTEELITELSRISSLRVISRTSVMRYKGTKKSLPEIAHELGADGIVEGSVLRSGNQVRITAQLIYAQQDTNVWAETYDRDLGNVLALQSEIANNIASAVKIESTPQEKELLKNAHSVNVKALEAYLQGEYSFKRMGAGEGITGYRSAISFFKQAIADDPNFAPAYVGLAQTYDGDFDWRPDEKMPLEKAATAKALELDAGLAEAHLMNASIKINYDFDLPGGEREIKAALRLNPNLAEAHEALASYLIGVGHAQEAIAEAHRAQELDPEGAHESRIFIATGQYDRAIDQFREYLQLHPNDGFAYIDNGLIDAYAFKGMRPESVNALARGWTLFGFKAIGEGVDRAYKTSGYEGAYRYSARQMERLYGDGKVYKPDYIASWYARSGDKELALKWLKILCRDPNRRDVWCLDIARDPDFALLRSDPRFQEFLQHAELRQ